MKLLTLIFMVLMVACGSSKSSGGGSESQSEVGSSSKPSKPEDASESFSDAEPIEEQTEAPAEVKDTVEVPSINPLVAQKAAEMDALILARVNELKTWNVWDDFRDKVTAGTDQLATFTEQSPEVDTWFHGNGTNSEFYQYEDYTQDWHTALRNDNRLHCDEAVDLTGSEFSVQYLNEPVGSRSALSIEVYLYSPNGPNGPIYITYLKLTWKLSTEASDHEYLVQAGCST